MRVLMLSWEYPPAIVGGLGRHVGELSPALAKLGVELYVITQSSPNTPSFEMKDGVHVLRVDANFLEPLDFINWVHQLNFAVLQEAIPLLNQKKFHLIHCHDWLTCMASRVLKHSYRIPLVATIHATEFGRRGGLQEPISRYIHSQEWLLGYEAWKVIVCSQWMMEEASRVLSLPGDKIKMIPNGIEPGKFDVDVEVGFRDKFALPEEKIILFVGRLVWEKGVDVLIDSAPLVLSRYPQTKFVVVGKGNIKEYVDRASSLGVAEKFYFTGYVDDETVFKLYKVADLCVYPSRYEPFGIVALEAMSNGIPPVVSDVGGFKETVEDGKTGVLTRVGDPFSLAEGILFLLENLHLKAEMGKRARERVMQYFRWEKVAQTTLSLYRKVVNERKQTAW